MMNLEHLMFYMKVYVKNEWATLESLVKYIHSKMGIARQS